MKGNAMKYDVLDTDGETIQQPYLSADDTWRAIEAWLGDMATDAEVSHVYAAARVANAIYWVEPHGFRFVDKFEPLDYLPEWTV